MSKYVIDKSTLSSIADAIRTKSGTIGTIQVSDIPNAIMNISSEGGTTLPYELLHYSGDCTYRFANENWNWIIENYGSQITTIDITRASAMFDNNSTIESIPFDLNFKQDTTVYYNGIFSGCNNLKEVGDINNLKIQDSANMFTACHNLRYLPTFNNIDFSSNYRYDSKNAFTECYSLRSIDPLFLKEIYTKSSNSDTSQWYYMFGDCYALDEIVGVNIGCSNQSIGQHHHPFANCMRAKNVIFATKDDGTPYIWNKRSQVIDMSFRLGYALYPKYILDYNSGIIANKEVTDDITYQLLKNDPDWFTCDVNYSRYNHDSAVRTINSLPDTSKAGYTGYDNIIKFEGVSGTNTDGGAINTLTETEIAVATAKGWTVTYA